MKKFLFVLVAGCCILPVSQIHADAFSILRNTRIKFGQAVSESDLQNLYQIVADHFEVNKKAPALEERKLPEQMLANPCHGLAGQPQIFDKLTPGNAGYVCSGAVLNGAGAVDEAAAPLAFEKLSIRNDGKIAVLFLSSKVEAVNMNAENGEKAVKAHQAKPPRPDAPSGADSPPPERSTARSNRR